MSVTDPGMSDHALVYVSRKYPKPKPEMFFIKALSYRNFDSVAFHRDACLLPWGLIFECDNVNQAAEILVGLIEGLANKHAPIKNIKCHVNQPKWITTELLSSIDEKQHWANMNRRRPSQYAAARKREAYIRVSKL